LIESLGGRYIAAGDMGIYPEDLDLVRQESRFVVGCSELYGGSGDSGIPTALGIYEGIKACTQEVYGSDSLSRRRILVQGVGKVGFTLLEYLANEGAEILISEVNSLALERATSHYSVQVVPPVEVYDVECDIFSPNATGAILNDDTIPRLRCSIIAGAANNQLAEPRHGQILHEIGILYAPDFIINAGGIINVADELEGYNRERAYKKVQAIRGRVERVLAISKEQGIDTQKAGNKLAEERIHIIGNVHRPFIPKAR
jgi:leucine dehydrogenase